MSAHVDFDPERAAASALRVNPSISTLSLSARTGEGLERRALKLENSRLSCPRKRAPRQAFPRLWIPAFKRE